MAEVQQQNTANMSMDKANAALDDLSTGTSDDENIAPVLAAAISRAKSFSASASAAVTPAKLEAAPPLRQLNETDDAPTLADEFPVRGFSTGQRLMEAIRSSIGASTFDALEAAWNGGKQERAESSQNINVSNYAKHASQEAEQRLKHMLIMPNAITVRLLSASVYLLVVTFLGGFVICSIILNRIMARIGHPDPNRFDINTAGVTLLLLGLMNFMRLLLSGGSRSNKIQYVCATINLVFCMTYIIQGMGWTYSITGAFGRDVQVQKYVEWTFSTPLIIILIGNLSAGNYKSAAEDANHRPPPRGQRSNDDTSESDDELHDNQLSDLDATTASQISGTTFHSVKYYFTSIFGNAAHSSLPLWQVVGADLTMLWCGLIGDLAPDPWKWIALFMSFATFVIVIIGMDFYLSTPASQIANQTYQSINTNSDGSSEQSSISENEFARTRRHNLRVLRFMRFWVAMTFSLFPAIWLISAAHLIDEMTEMWLYYISDMLAKVGLNAGLYALNSNAVEEAMSLRERLLELQLAEQIQQAAQRANDNRNQFLRYLFHEIRGPLNAVVLGLRDIRSYDCDPDFIDTVGIMSDSLNRVSRLLDDANSLYKFDSGHFVLEESAFSMQKLIFRTLKMLQTQIHGKHAKVRCRMDSTLPIIIADKYKIQQVIANLVSNAVKFGPSRGRIVITVTVLTETTVDRSRGFREVSEVDNSTGQKAPNAEAKRNRAMAAFMLRNRPLVNGVPLPSKQHSESDGFRHLDNVERRPRRSSSRSPPVQTKNSRAIWAKDAMQDLPMTPLTESRSLASPSGTSKQQIALEQRHASAPLPGRQQSKKKHTSSPRSNAHPSPSQQAKQIAGYNDPNTLWIRVSVRDQGSGIADEDQIKLFQPYEHIRSGGTSMKSNTTGLGLSVSSRIIQNLRGRIGVNTAMGVGSEFFFDIPVKRATITDLSVSRHTDDSSDDDEDTDSRTLDDEQYGGQVYKLREVLSPVSNASKNSSSDSTANEKGLFERVAGRKARVERASRNSGSSSAAFADIITFSSLNSPSISSDSGAESSRSNSQRSNSNSNAAHDTSTGSKSNRSSRAAARDTDNLQTADEIKEPTTSDVFSPRMPPTPVGHVAESPFGHSNASSASPNHRRLSSRSNAPLESPRRQHNRPPPLKEIQSNARPDRVDEGQITTPQPLQPIRSTASRKSDQPLSPNSTSPQPNAGPRYILIVDDVASNRTLLSKLLNKQGYTCEHAENGQEAIDIVTETEETRRKYTAILMDFEMPILNGSDATHLLREAGITCPIIGVTGNTLQSDQDVFLKAGANQVLFKPVKVPKLVASIKLFSKEHRRLHENAGSSASSDSLASRNLSSDATGNAISPRGSRNSSSVMTPHDPLAVIPTPTGNELSTTSRQASEASKRAAMDRLHNLSKV